MIARDLADFEGWVRSHSAALAAWCVSALPASDARRELASLWLDAAFAANVRSLSSRTEDFPEDESNLAGGHALWTLTEYPLRMLARLSACLDALPQSIEPLPAMAAKLWEARTRPRRFGAQVVPSRARATNIISSSIVDGLTTAEGILALAGRILHRDWRAVSNDQTVLNALQGALPRLRRMPGEPGSKLQALISIRKALKELPSDVVEGDRGLGWSSIEFGIVNSLFSWPLLVVPSGSTNAIGLSIPILIDLRSDQLHAEKAVFVKGSSNRLREDWHDSVERAHGAAIALWLKETGFFGSSWRERVSQHSQAVFDVSAAEMLLDTVGEVEWESDRFEFEMEGRSLELPVALALFSQLRGLRAPCAAGSTGMLGDVNDAVGTQPNQDEDKVHLETLSGQTVLDRELLVPGGLVEKLGWADAAGIFDKLIFPQLTLTDSLSGDGERQQRELEALQLYLTENSSPHRPQINYCKQLSNAADAAFRGQWRRTQLVRCPELSLMLRTEQAVGYRKNATHLTEVFSASTSTVMVLPDDMPFSDICGALAWLNLYGRDYHEAGLGTPPMLATAFVRLVRDEGGDRLCAVLCETARAPVESIHHVCSALSEAERGRRLANVLNRRLQDQRYPGWRAPDLIVLGIPQEGLRELLTPQLGGRDVWRASLAPLLSTQFSTSLQQIADERWGNTLGSVRIAFAVDRDFEWPGAAAAGNGAEDEPTTDDIPAETLLEPLRVFRSEFTQQEARLLMHELGLQGMGVRRALQTLRKRGFLHYAHGSWMLTKSGRQKKSLSVSQVSRDQADLHMAAAVARAPYLSAQRLPGLPDFEARRADRIHEAQFHVSKALTEDIANDQRSWLQACKARLALHFDIPGWGLISQAASDGDLTRERLWANAIIALGEQLLATGLRNSEDIDPNRIISLFRVIEQRKKRIEGSYPTIVAAQQDDEWRKLTEKSLHVIETYAGIARGKPDWGLPGVDGKDAEGEQLVSGISIVAILLAGRYRLTLPERNSLSTWLRQALSVVPADTLDIPPTWFEQQGDAVKSHKEAREWYERGYRAVPGYMGNWIKALGCLAEDHEEYIDEIIADLKAFARQNPEQWKKMEAFMKRPEKRELAMNPRWRTGIQNAIDRGLVVW